MEEPNYCMRTGEKKRDCGCNRCQEEARIANPIRDEDKDKE